jgi:hypothetical protein
MPKAFEAYNDKVFMCHGWPGIGSGLAAVDQESERILINELLENLAGVFKWDLDTKPDLSHDSDTRCAVASDPARPRADVILMGGSNCQHLHSTLAEMEVSVETVSSRIWTINTKAVDICLKPHRPVGSGQPLLQG